MSAWEGDVSSGLIGEIELGMSRSRVREVFGDDFRTFRRTPESQEVDRSGPVMVSYRDAVCVFVEVVSPAHPSFHGIELLNRRLTIARAELEHAGYDVVDVDAATYEISGSNVGLYVEGGIVKGVSFGRE